MSDEAAPVETFFIVAFTDPGGFEVIASRIGRELQNFDNASKLPIISSTTLLIVPGQTREEQIGEVTARIERLVQAHLLAKEKLK
jgi:pyruvate-formate lyase-activating enzyme